MGSTPNISGTSQRFLDLYNLSTSSLFAFHADNLASLYFLTKGNTYKHKTDKKKIYANVDCIQTNL